MRCFFDTSVLVAASVRQHPHFTRADEAVRRCLSGEDTGLVHSHSLLEFHSAMTQLPKGLAVPPLEVNLILAEGILSHMECRALSRAKVVEAQRLAAEAGLIGGVVYDFFHLIAAREMKADIVWTFNLRHFEAIMPPGMPFRISEP
jgi:predicted nucleic acid-binding protein